MILKKLKDAIFRIYDSIKSIFQQPPPTDNNNQPAPKDIPSETNSDLADDVPSPNDNGDQPVPKEVPPKTEHDSTKETPSDKSPKEPSHRGGARGGSKLPTHVGTSKREKTSLEDRPELICRERSRIWEILLVLPANANADVYQGQVPVSPESGREYSLSNFRDEVTINWGNNNQDTIKLFVGNFPLLFKHRKDWSGDGKRVNRMSVGHYICFTPNEWIRKTDTPPIGKGLSTDPKFSAHHFFVERNDTSDGFNECGSLFSGIRFSIGGEKIIDDSNQGDLFVGDDLKLHDTENWRGVTWISIGEEGGRWRGNFKPTDETLESILGDREGWFFVRIYDDETHLIESFDFRRQIKLENILINGCPHSPENIMAPDKRGHPDTTIEFVGEEISVKNKNLGNKHVSTKDNTAIIKPHPDFDKTVWVIDEKTEIVVRLPRIWWRLKKHGDKEEKWRDTNVEMTRNEFRKNRDTKINFCLPIVAENILVGFGSPKKYDGARSYKAIFNEHRETKFAEFELRDFSAFREILKDKREASMQIKCGETEFPIIHIPDETPPPVESPTTTKNPKRKPTVDKFSSGNRLRPTTKNKGYSGSELNAVGITLAEARHMGVIFDFRRKSKHDINVKQIQDLCPGENHAK